MSVPRGFATADSLPDGRIILIGGYGGATQCTGPRIAEIFNPATRTFAAGPALITPRYQHTSTTLPDGSIVVVGGSDCSVAVSAVERYVPASNAFVAAGSLTTGRQNHTATLLPNGKILVAGGFTAAGYTNSVELYDPATNTSAPTGSMTSPRASYQAALLPDGTVLATGGFNGAGYVASAEIYNAATGTWTPAASMTIARGHAQTTTLSDGRVLFTGGYDGTAYVASAEIYTPSTGTFAATGSMTVARGSHTTTLLPDGTVLVAGGFTPPSGQTASVNIFNPATGTFATYDSMTTARQVHAAAMTADGLVLLAGGFNAGGYLASAETFDFSPAPTANAGADQVLTADAFGMATVTLTGSATGIRPPFAYRWINASGSTVGTGATISIPVSIGIHTFTLEVTDASGRIALDSVTVSVQLPATPGPIGPTGPAGPPGPAGAGLSFVVQQLTGSGTVTLPANTASVVVLVSSDIRRDSPIVTLPAAETAASRFVVIRNMSVRIDVSVRPPSGGIVGGADPSSVTLSNQFDQVVLVSDGTHWIIFSR